MEIVTWLAGEEFKPMAQWSITVNGDMASFERLLSTYPTASALVFYRGNGIGFVHFAHDETSEEADDLWHFVASEVGKTVKRMTGYHAASLVSIGGF